MGAYGLSESFVPGKAGLVDRLQIERHEPLALLVGDLQVAVHVDDVLKAHLTRESIWPSERLGGEPGEVIVIMRAPLRENRAHGRIGDGRRVEQTLEALQG